MLEDSHSYEAQPLFMETILKISQNPTWVSGLLREATLPRKVTCSRRPSDHSRPLFLSKAVAASSSAAIGPHGYGTEHLFSAFWEISLFQT